jgi:hypothetical protein
MLCSRASSPSLLCATLLPSTSAMGMASATACAASWSAWF